MKERLTVIVAGGSKLKQEASGIAFGIIFPDHEIEVKKKKSRSGVNEQPMEQETGEGASNRLAGILPEGELPPNTWYIAIENGGRVEEGPNGGNRFVDRGVPMVKGPDGRLRVGLSDGVVFPWEAYLRAREKGFEKTAVGWETADLLGCDPADPHYELTGISRVDLLVNCLLKMFDPQAPCVPTRVFDEKDKEHRSLAVSSGK